MAEDHAFQQKVVGAASGMLAAVDQHPHLVEGLGVDQRLMGTLHDHPVLPILFQALLGFIADFHAAALHHVANIGLVLQHIRNALAAPQAGIGAWIGHWKPSIGGRGRHSFYIQLACDLAATHTGQRHTEYPPYHRSSLFINDDFIFLRGVHLIAIDRLAADELSLPLFIPLDALDLLGDVLGVHVVHDGPERCNVVGCGLHAGVNAVQQRDVPHPLFRKVPLHIVAGHDVVTAQTAQILGNDHVDFLGFNVPDHPLKIRAVKICSAPAVIHIGVIDRKPVLLYKLLQKGFLICDAL